ncbi:importin-7 isoform X2 [Neocloeon triangulifer]|uniref:importin-7 isoform X2 n=1 Tax=Neocloeon triangulifer TaxID=2078957 RepID=UPI00286F401B|nr:importin-7 isoform X2 [Neocloeon triangulifer]
MDSKRIIEILKGTIDSNYRQEAEEQLNQIHKIIGFAPALLQAIMINDVDLPVRQAGAIYFKNLISQFWADKETDPGEPLAFNIHEQDRAMIRDLIVDAVVVAPEKLRVQLAVCVNNIIRHDFPDRWAQVVDKISICLQNPDRSGWLGALICMYQLVKNYEYSNKEKRTPLYEAMNLLFPQLYQLACGIWNEDTEESTVLQKQILKIFFSFTQYTLPLELITKQFFQQWMDLVRIMVNKEVPAVVDSLSDEDKADTACWKAKKWALYILQRMFERYGSPGFVSKEYKEFAEWYLKTFSAAILETLLKVLDKRRRKMFVSPKVLCQSFKYVEQAIKHAYTWKFLKPHMLIVVQEIIFPVMCHSPEDEELWQTDPIEYVHTKFELIDDFMDPVTAAQALLLVVCKKRKAILPKCMAFVVQILNAQQNADPSLRDGALNMVGTLAELLIKKKEYCDQVCGMLQQYVFPELKAPQGHLRARACSVIKSFSDVDFTQGGILKETIYYLIECLVNEKELPVKVQAVVALEAIASSQEGVTPFIEPQIKNVVLEMLNLIRETESDEVASSLQKLVCTFTELLAPIAVDITKHLATTLIQVLDTDGGSDEKAMIAMGLLHTVESLLNAMEEVPGLTTLLEPVVLQVIGYIFENSVMEFYEETLLLVYELTKKTISNDMWQVLGLLYTVFGRDGFDYFTEMMPALHNYVTVDTPAFLASQDRILVMCNMARDVLNGDAGEDPECHAAKLLEVIILQCKGHIDQFIPPIVELVLMRLTKEVKSSELRAMCLQVVIAALYYNPELLFRILNDVKLPQAPNDSVTSHFINQWLLDTDCFLGLHDRKLSVLGLCMLMQNPVRPIAVNECAPKILPALLVLFEGLKRAYSAKGNDSDSDSDSDDDDDSINEDELESDEDDIDEDGAVYLESLEDKLKKNADGSFNIQTSIMTEGGDDDDEDDDEDWMNEDPTALEDYSTPLDADDCNIDEYIIFKEVLAGLQERDPAWYQHLTGQLTMEQQKKIQDVFTLADQRRAAAESKRIEESGGYIFSQQTVPTKFNFGGNS